MDKSFVQIINTSALISLGTFVLVSGGLLLEYKETINIDWRDLALLGATGACISSWSLFKNKY